MSDTVRMYWATCGYRCGNAGDEVAKDIVATLSGKKVVQAEIKDASLVAIGSIAQDIPRDYAGAIWGTGLMFEHGRGYAPEAWVCALRGSLTAARWEGIGAVALGDPGLLATEVYGVTRSLKPRYRVGAVPHYVDGQNMGLREWARIFRDDVTVIDICAPPIDVLRAMADCAHIVSSSLHGLVFADALEIPNAWVVLSDGVQGGSFKFRDYYSVFGIDDPRAISFGATTKPDDIVSQLQGYRRPGLASVQEALRNSFPDLG